MKDTVAVDPAEWYETLARPSLAGEVDRGQAVILRYYAGTSALMEKPGLSDNVVCVHQGGAKRVHRWEAGIHRSWDVPEGAVSLMPRFRANRWWTDGPIAFTHVTLSAGVLARMAREEFDRDPRDLAVMDRVGISDPLITRLVETLADIVRAPPPGRLFRESLLTALIVQVLLRHSSMHALPMPARARGGLAGWQLHRIIDFMAANLAQDIGVAELVPLVGLSRAQIFRAFRESTEQTPGRYLLGLRMERARHLLSEPAATVDGVARSVGFGDADSFTRAFRRSAGLSPAAWRRAHGRSDSGGEPA